MDTSHFRASDWAARSPTCSWGRPKLLWGRRRGEDRGGGGGGGAAAGRLRACSVGLGGCKWPHVYRQGPALAPGVGGPCMPALDSTLTSTARPHPRVLLILLLSGGGSGVMQSTRVHVHTALSCGQACPHMRGWQAAAAACSLRCSLGGDSRPLHPAVLQPFNLGQPPPQAAVAVDLCVGREGTRWGRGGGGAVGVVMWRPQHPPAPIKTHRHQRPSTQDTHQDKECPPPAPIRLKCTHHLHPPGRGAPPPAAATSPAWQHLPAPTRTKSSQITQRPQRVAVVQWASATGMMPAGRQASKQPGMMSAGRPAGGRAGGQAHPRSSAGQRPTRPWPAEPP